MSKSQTMVKVKITVVKNSKIRNILAKNTSKKLVTLVISKSFSNFLKIIMLHRFNKNRGKFKKTIFNITFIVRDKIYSRNKSFKIHCFQCLTRLGFKIEKKKEKTNRANNNWCEKIIFCFVCFCGKTKNLLACNNRFLLWRLQVKSVTDELALYAVFCFLFQGYFSCIVGTQHV